VEETLPPPPARIVLVMRNKEDTQISVRTHTYTHAHLQPTQRPETRRGPLFYSVSEEESTDSLSISIGIQVGFLFILILIYLINLSVILHGAAEARNRRPRRPRGGARRLDTVGEVRCIRWGEQMGGADDHRGGKRERQR
jgi:hypothetical protein